MNDTQTGGTFWALVVAAFLTILILSGGISVPSPEILTIQTAVSLVIFGLSVARLAVFGFPSTFAYWATVLIILSVLLLLLQIFPLPISWVEHLAGHEWLQREAALLGTELHTSSLSLTPVETKRDLLAILPAIAAFSAALTIKPSKLYWPAILIVLCALVSVFFALLQRFLGDRSGLYFYDLAHGIGTGTFNNRNFFAAQIYVSIPILAALAEDIRQKFSIRGWLVMAFGFFYAGIMVVGLALSGSRMGLILAMPSIVIAVILVRYGQSRQNRFSMPVTVIMSVLLGLIVMMQASMLSLLRIFQTEPLADYRALISGTTFNMMKTYLPYGAGFGSFVPVYQLHETPAIMQPQFINHAHNDWAELVVEGGWPALALLVFFVILFGYSLLEIWYRNQLSTIRYHRAATASIALLLAHSFVDYPLRTPALLTIFGFCAGLLALPISKKKPLRKSRSSPEQSDMLPIIKKPLQELAGEVATPPPIEERQLH